jgi:hypothetical protein
LAVQFVDLPPQRFQVEFSSTLGVRFGHRLTAERNWSFDNRVLLPLR